MATKTTVGIARKPEDVKRIYELATMRATSKGRKTKKGEEFSEFINEIFDYMGIEEVPVNVVVEYINEATGNSRDDKEMRSLKTSVNGFLKTKYGKQLFKVSEGIIEKNNY